MKSVAPSTKALILIGPWYCDLHWSCLWAFNITGRLPILLKQANNMSAKLKKVHLMMQMFRWVIRDTLSIKLSCDLKFAQVEGSSRQN